MPAGGKNGRRTLRLDDPLNWCWLPLTLLRHRLTAELRAWIELDTSLTRALAAWSGRPVRLQVVRTGPARATPMETVRLGLKRPGARVYGREIALWTGDAAVLRARSVTRLRDPSVPLLEGLGRRPLAELLFESPRFLRDPVLDLIVPRGAALAAPVVGRCGRWYLQTRRRTGTLLVEEYFQPAFLESVARAR